jgi:penicillin-binding protein 1A
LLRFISTLLTALLCTALVAGAAVVGMFYYYGRSLPSYQQLANYQPPVLTRFYANDGRVFGEYAKEKRLYVPLRAIPQRVKDAFISAEDKNFYTHMGVDVPSIIGAAVSNISRIQASKRPIGASTITQQVTKNFLLADISCLVSLERKIKEAILAVRIENAYTKDYILELYLNEIYLGGGAYGVAAAALYYFNKGLDDLTLQEAAFLAALPKAPNHYHPTKNHARALERRNYVLIRMRDDNKITPAEAAAAIASPLEPKVRALGQSVEGEYFAEEVRRELIEKFGEQSLYNDGYVVRTTLNPVYQEFAEESLQAGLEIYDRRHGWRGPLTHLTLPTQESPPTANGPWVEHFKTMPSFVGGKKWTRALVLSCQKDTAVVGLATGEIGRIPLSELTWARKYIGADSLGPAITSAQQVLSVGDVIFVQRLEDGKEAYRLCQVPEVSGGLVVMDPHSGRVLAMQGGFNFNASQFNRATQAMRQTGSAFKTVVYLTALEKGVSPSTIIDDSPFVINMGHGLGVWRPHNYDNSFMGPMTMRRAFELSRNTVTIRLTHELLGIKSVAEMADRLDVIHNMPRQLAMVLGAGETTLLKMATAHAMIANGGKKIHPTLIDRIQNRHGKNVFVRDDLSCIGGTTSLMDMPFLEDHRAQILDPVAAYQMVSFLEGAVQRGTARQLASLGHPLAGKTGTTNDFKDAWFVGFSPDLLVAAYIGFDHPRYMGNHQSGARVGLIPVFEFFKRALVGKAPIPFRMPPGVKLMRVNANSGRPASEEDGPVILEAFNPKAKETPSRVSGDTSDPASDQEALEEAAPSDEDDRSSADRDALDHLVDTHTPKESVSGTGGLY